MPPISPFVHSANTLSCSPGHHPWFSYLISTQPALSKDDHYRGLFLGTSPGKPEHVQAYQTLLDSLPEPIPISDVLMELRRNFEDFPQAMLGEVGLDRSFRVPFDYLASPRELTPFVIPLHHQLVILEAQLDLAVELSRNVSLHSVKSQLPTTELLQKMQHRFHDRWSHINIDIHSCGLSPETWRDIEACHARNYVFKLSYS
jgi:Tat protein secretion system quality control protein TatD with DNase activity